MTLLLVGCTLIGTVLLTCTIYKYYGSLRLLQWQSSTQKLFSSWTYMMLLVLMVFFLLGYIGMGVYFLSVRSYDGFDLLIALILLFGGVFVCAAITVQRHMSQAISGKTEEIIRSLVNAMEAKDQYTRGHSVHVSNLVKLFYQYLPDHLKKQVNLQVLADAAILHDIGKIGISDAILNKPGPLTDEEMAVIRTHPRMGKQILEHSSFAALGDIILAHHERMDSKGYYRLPPENISLESRMIAIADTFSALYSDRVYRPRRTYAVTMQIVREAAGSQLDPELVEIFVNIPEQEIDKASHNLFALEEKN